MGFTRGKMYSFSLPKAKYCENISLQHGASVNMLFCLLPLLRPLQPSVLLHLFLILLKYSVHNVSSLLASLFLFSDS